MSSVLYDAPGPRTKRRTVVFSILAVIVILIGLYFLVYRPLDEKGQFSEQAWGSLLDPENENTPLVWKRLGEGLRATLTAAALAIMTSLVCGTALAILRLQLRSLRKRRFAGLPQPVALGLRWLSILLNAVTRACVEVFRGIPVVVTIFFCWRVLSDLRDPMWPLVIGLTIYNMVVIAEVIRSGMEGLPFGQREAAEAVGLSPLQTVWLIQLPQAVRVMLPALISQMVVILKDTSLGFLITYEDLLRVTGQINEILHTPIQLYLVVGTIFLLINYSLSKLAQFTERRLRRGLAG